MITFFVPGVPKSTQTGSIIRAGGRAFPSRRGTPWSAVCGMVARQYAPATPLQGALWVALEFRFVKPKGVKRVYPIVRPDLENLVKGLMDSWNGCLWEDDSQVIGLRISKVYADLPGVDVRVLEVS